MTGFDRAAIETELHECETAGSDMHPSYVRECLAEIDRLTLEDWILEDWILEDWIPEAVWDRATQTWVDLPEGTTWADLEASRPTEGDDE